MLFQDSYDGLYPRWHISYNITMLRIISYNMDLHWASTGAESPQVRTYLLLGLCVVTGTG